MLKCGRRGRHASERGQTLILALAFIAFFSLVVGSVLGVADLSGLQHLHTEATASSDSLAEGGAAYAAADAGRLDLSLTCAANQGRLTMQGGDAVQYTVRMCQGPAGGAGDKGPGTNCVLCILNKFGTPATPVLQATCARCGAAAVQTTGGDVYVNGSIGSSQVPTSLTALATASPVSYAHIRMLYGANATHCTCTPTATAYAPAITDPLASTPTPSTADEPKICTTSSSCKPNKFCHLVAGAIWNPATGCSWSVQSTEATLGPGLWSALSVSGNSTTQVTLDDASGSPGMYVFTGPLSVAGNGTVAGSDITMYLACSNYTSGNSCSGSGGSIAFGGNGSTTLSASTAGTYQGIAVLTDPLLPDPGGTSCASQGGGCLYSTSGNGASISGSVDTRSGGTSIGGNGGQSVSSGRLITNSLFMSVSGNVGSGLTLSGTGVLGVSPSACGLFDDSPVSGTTPTGASSSGRAIIQSQCGNGSVSGVVDFNYKP